LRTRSQVTHLPGDNISGWVGPLLALSILFLEVMLMDGKFDIFKKLPDGHPIWIKAVEGLEEARNQLDQMSRTAPGEYFIFNTRNGQILVFA